LAAQKINEQDYLQKQRGARPHAWANLLTPVAA
jgi:hypothetical protein